MEEAMRNSVFAVMLAAAMLFAVSPLLAQGVVLGVTGGPTMATCTGDDAQDFTMKTGAAAGVFLRYGVTGIFAIQSELLLSKKGAKDNGWQDINSNPIEASMNLNYLEIPLLVRIAFPAEWKVRPNLYAGPALGILLSAREKVGGENVDIKGLYKSTDVGIVLGAGVDYRTEKGLLFLEARYEMGLRTVMDLGAGELAAEGLTAQPDVRNSVSSIMVGYGFAM
jgi:hypothetical protein